MVVVGGEQVADLGVPTGSFLRARGEEDRGRAKTTAAGKEGA